MLHTAKMSRVLVSLHIDVAVSIKDPQTDYVDILGTQPAAQLGVVQPLELKAIQQ